MEIKKIDLNKRVINIFGDIDESNVNDAISKIIEINIDDDEYFNNIYTTINSIGYKIPDGTNESMVPPITINLSTFGGDIYSGLGLCDAIRTSNTPIKVVCYGKIMSMGIPVLLSAKYKIASKNTTFMIHGASGGCFGKIESIKENINEADRVQNIIIDYILENSKFPKKKLQDIIEKKQDFYFTADEALEWKIIDEII